jgi:predicted RNase H-like HicB family nuclease
MKFKVVVSKGMDFGYVVEVPSLPGCFSQGDTIDEALANIREAIELYIEDMSTEEKEKAAASSTELYEVAV